MERAHAHIHTYTCTSVQSEALKEQVAEERREEESWKQELKEIEGGSAREAIHVRIIIAHASKIMSLTVFKPTLLLQSSPLMRKRDMKSTSRRGKSYWRSSR